MACLANINKTIFYEHPLIYAYRKHKDSLFHISYENFVGRGEELFEKENGSDKFPYVYIQCMYSESKRKRSKNSKWFYCRLMKL